MLKTVERSQNNHIRFSFFLCLRSLYHNMAQDKGTGDNILVSPVVVASSLGVLALGGKAATASQVKTVLRADTLKDEHLHAGLSELMAEVRNSQQGFNIMSSISQLFHFLISCCVTHPPPYSQRMP